MSWLKKWQHVESPLQEINSPTLLSKTPTTYGTMGSNGCTFTALSFGHQYFANGLQPPIASQLQNNWKVSLIEAKLSGNGIHNDIFDGDAVNVAADNAIEIAAGECFVDKIDLSMTLVQIVWSS